MGSCITHFPILRSTSETELSSLISSAAIQYFYRARQHGSLFRRVLLFLKYCLITCCHNFPLFFELHYWSNGSSYLLFTMRILLRPFLNSLVCNNTLIYFESPSPIILSQIFYYRSALAFRYIFEL